MAESGSAAYYRAIKDGNWSDTTTWEASTDGGTIWVAATGFPGDTSGVQDTIYDLQGHVVSYDVNMVGSVTFDDVIVTDGEVVLPDTDPGIDLIINGGLLKFLNFDLATKSWDRNININLDGNRLKNCTIKDDTPLLVVKIISDTSSTEKVVKLYDLRKKAYVENVTGTEIQAGQTIWYDYDTSDTISAVSYNSSTKEFTITLSSGITTLGVGDMLVVENQKIRISSVNYAGIIYSYTRLENVFFRFTGTTASTGAARLGRLYALFMNSIVLFTTRGAYMNAVNSFVAHANTGLGSEYGSINLKDCYLAENYVSYNEFFLDGVLVRSWSNPLYLYKIKNVELFQPATLAFNSYYNKLPYQANNVKNISSLSFPFNNLYLFDNPVILRDFEVNGILQDFIFVDNTGYLQRVHSNGYWEAIGDAWYYAEGEVKTAMTSPLCFYHQNASGGTGTVQVFVNGALVKEESFTLSATKTIQCVDIAVKPGDNVQIYISVPDETLLWTDAIEERFNAGDKFQCC